MMNTSMFLGHHVKEGAHQNAEREDCVSDVDIIEHVSFLCCVQFIIP